MPKLSILFTLAAATLAAADFPQAEISNGSVRAKLYLPDARQGYYRATRFDWSGQIASLEFQGHNFFGQWFDRYDPKLHDSILGPVEEFLTNGMGLGYKDVKAGESFVKIGVGVLQIYSATRETDYTSAWWKQIIYVAGGLVLMWLMMAVDYHSMLHYVPALYIGSLAALLMQFTISSRPSLPNGTW